MARQVPMAASDVLLHQKDTDRTERIALPFTRYANVFNAPRVVNDVDDIAGAPFFLLETDKETLSDTEIRRICGDIL